MNAVVFIGKDKKFVFNLAKKLAEVFTLNHVDIDESFELDLLFENNGNLLNNDLILENKETLIIKKNSQKKNVFISISDDTFLANEHYKNFHNNVKIYIKNKENSRLKQKIQNFIESLCDYTINQEYININELIKFIRGKNNG